MANHASALKAHRQSLRRRLRNRSNRSRLRTALNRFSELLTTGKVAEARQSLGVREDLDKHKDIDITLIRDTYRLLISSIVYGLIIASSAGLLVLALSSLSRNSRYIALFWLGIWFVSGILSTILQDAARHEHRQEFFNSQQVISPTPQMRRQLRLTSAWDDFEKAELERSKTDWRPIVSYTGNLSRIGEKLLGSNKAWESLATIRPFSERTQFLSTWLGPQYPWYWSGFVLVGLFGLSACILNFRVRSLDRLK